MNDGGSKAQRRIAYGREWAAKTGRPESEIYIPLALRDHDEVDAEAAAVSETTVVALRLSAKDDAARHDPLVA